MRNFVDEIYVAMVFAIAAISVNAQVSPGQVLNTAQPNSAFSGVLPLTGGTLKGPLGFANTAAATATTTQVRYVQATTGGIPRSLTNKPQDRTSVLDFAGCDITGLTDSSACIQNGTDTTSSTGKVLYFPAGNYMLLSYVTWPAGTKWVCEPGASISFNPAMSLGATIGGTPRAMYNTGTGSLSLDGCTFNGVATGLTQAITIAVNNARGVRIANNTFQNFGNATYYAQGLIAYNSTDVRLNNNRFLNNSGDGAAFSNNVTNFVVSGNEFSNNGDWGLVISISCTQGTVQGNLFVNNTSTSTGVDRSTNITIIGNTMIGGSYGVRITRFANTTDINQNITISGNTVLNPTTLGISVEGASAQHSKGVVSVTGNTIIGSPNQGILVTDSINLSITGNTIYNSAADGILFNAVTSGLETGRAAITGNKIDGATYGVRQINGAGTPSNITVFGNDISNASVASYVLTNASNLGAGTFTSVTHTQQEIDSNYQISTPTTGQTVTIGPGTETMLLVPAGKLESLTVTLPGCSAAYSGSLVRFSSSQAITSLLVNSASGNVAAPPSSASLGQGYGFICHGGGATWFRLY